NHHAAFGDFADVVDKGHAAALEIVHHMLVVHDLMKHINRRPDFLEHAIYTLDGHVHAGTESAGVGKDDSHWFAGFYRFRGARSNFAPQHAGPDASGPDPAAQRPAWRDTDCAS